MIDKIFENLSDEDKQRLMIGFNGEFAQFVKLPDDKFIGVNIVADKQFRILEENGSWCYGEILCQQSPS